jgi:hypothetical protein
MGSYEHKCRKTSIENCFCKIEIAWSCSWAVDHRVNGSGAKKKRKFYRVVGEISARRFCKKWGLSFSK